MNAVDAVGTCRHCGGDSGHPPLTTHSSREAECFITGIRISRREARVCYPCIIRLGREVAARFADDEAQSEAAIARRLLAISHPNSASYLRHRSQHELHYVPSCEYCRLEEAA